MGYLVCVTAPKNLIRKRRKPHNRKKVKHLKTEHGYVDKRKHSGEVTRRKTKTKLRQCIICGSANDTCKMIVETSRENDSD